MRSAVVSTSSFLYYWTLLASSTSGCSAFVVPTRRFCHGHDASTNTASSSNTIPTARSSSSTITTSTTLFYGEKDSVAQDALERTAAHLDRLRGQQRGGSAADPFRMENDNDDGLPDNINPAEYHRLKQDYLRQSANALKQELQRRKLPRNGRKPDLAGRLAQHDLLLEQQPQDDASVVADQEAWIEENIRGNNSDKDILAVARFAGLPLSEAAGLALGRAGFYEPTPIQAVVIPLLAGVAGTSKSSGNKQQQQQRGAKPPSCIIHSETGSGKSLAYLLPATEELWKQQQQSTNNNNNNIQRTLILTPTRELAAQVAGIASVLAPPGTVRLVAQPSNLMNDGAKDRGEAEHGGRNNDSAMPQIFVGSAKAVLHSLYGDGKMPAPPTPKPLAMQFLQSVHYLVLDEVDRLLNVQKSRGSAKSSKNKQHEKPAATLTAAVERCSLGRAQLVAASATVGRPLRRELARVLGLAPNECPPVVRVMEENGGENEETAAVIGETNAVVLEQPQQQQHGRSVTIPGTVQNYIYAVNGSSEGKLLTGAFQLIQRIHQSKNHNKPRRMLLVLSRSFGMNTQNAIGALRHFKLQPEPQALLDVLQGDGGHGTDQMMERHRLVSGASGVGEASTSYFDAATTNLQEYLYVTGEDTVRGLHLDGLDMVIVVGRPNGPDEYTHIAGRTGRAGKSGKVINVVSHENGAALKSWERMLESEFTSIGLDNVGNL